MEKGIHITLSLTGKTPEELSKKTVAAQLNWGMEFNFFDFTQRKDGTYICWFKMPFTVYSEKVANGKA